jgi:3-oxoacyl-[acyl-carrier protein] reductase
MTGEAGRKVALVTGASEGIGHAIALRLLADGYRVAMLARQPDKLRLACDGLGPDAKDFACDLGDSDEIDRTVAEARAWGGRIDALINCASTTRTGTALSLTDAEWVSGFEIKVLGALRLMRACWPMLCEVRGGVVNIGGVGARTPRDGSAMTGPLSASLMALTKVFADRGVEDGVRVNMINPGGVLTPRFVAMMEQRAQAEGRSLEDVLATMARASGSTRVGRPEDVAELTAYLLSPRADLLQGAIIDLDGGMTKSM